MIKTVLHIIPGLKLGGSESLLFNMVKSSSKNLFHHQVLCTDPGGYFIDEFRKINVPVSIVDFGIKHESNYLKIPTLIRRVDEISPDIIHSHSQKYHLIMFPLMALLLKKRPLFFNTIHDQYRFKHYFKPILFEKIANRVMTGQIAISKEVKKYHTDTFHANENKIFVVENGIDLSPFIPKQSVPFRKRIVTVANLRTDKGYFIALEAVRQLLPSHPDLSYHIIGDGHLRTEIQNFIQGNNLSDHIHLYGSRPNVPQILSDMDIFMLPSLIEGFGLAVVEALAAGLPVLATDNGGVPEILENGKCGILAKTGDVQSLKEGLNLYLSNEKLRAEMSRKGPERAEHYSIQNMIAKIEDLYLKASESKNN